MSASRPCDHEPGKSMPFCDNSLSLSERIDNLVENLTVKEKINLVSSTSYAIPRLHIGVYEWWNEALHGIGISPGVKFGGEVPSATSFPQVITTGATFNRTLWHSIGSAISTEGRAMSNVHRAGLTYWTPNINIQRDPRWGRGQETPGEDPFATGEYVAHFVRGMQEGSDINYLKVSTCCKHYAAYSLENWGGVDRHHFDAIVTEQDMADTYLPAFQSCIERGNSSSLMCSYNSINGIPSCANADLLTKARKQWGFEGYIVSDCGAVDDVLTNHQFTNNTSATCKAVLEAGMDLNCGGPLRGNFLHKHLKASIDDKSTSISTVDKALKNSFSVQFRLGMFDPVSIQPYMQISIDSINSPGHQQLALEAAQQGIVLLKNNGVLPLSASIIKNIAVIGPNGNATKRMQGNYNGIAPYLISPLDGILKYVPHTTYTEGCSIASPFKLGFNAAKDAAKNADVTVIIVGLDQFEEREGHDRTKISLPGVQDDLLKEIPPVAKGPVIVVVMAGGQVDLTIAKNSKHISALLWCGYPGQSGGEAIADVLFGAINPGGRLPYTIYPSDYITGLSMFDMNMRPNPSRGNPGRTYRFYTGTPVFPYGTGFSYTTFNYSSSIAELQLPLRSILECIGEELSYIPQPNTTMTNISITVTNVGKVAGSDVVMAFLASPSAGQQGVALKNLVGFERVYLAVGESTTVDFPVTAHDLTIVTPQGRRVAVPGNWLMSIGSEEKITISIDVAE